MSNTTYPGSIDSPTNPSTSDTLATAPHHTQHGLVNDAVVAIETKLGTGSSGQTPSNGSFLVGNGAGATQWVNTLTSPSVTTSLLDANNKTWLGVNPAGSSAVNYPNLGNSVTGSAITYGAAGSDSNISTNVTSKGSGKVQDNGSNLIDFRSSFQNFIQTGGVWTQNAGLVGSMTALTLWIAGIQYSVAAVASHTFGASVDTYIDYTVGTGITYTAVSNNAASPALAANSVRLSIVVTNGSAITFINQGQTDTTLTNFGPTVSSNALTVSDSLGNRIYPTNPNGGLIGYRQITAPFTSTTTPGYVAVTGMSMPIQIPTGRSVDITVYCPALKSSAIAGSGVNLAILESSTVLGAASFAEPISNYPFQVNTRAILGAPTAGTHTYTVDASQSAAGTLSVGAGNGAAGNPGVCFIVAELK